MAMFDVGDIVIGNEDNHYAITKQDVYCVVMENFGGGFIGVSLLDDDTVFTVEEKCFDYVTSIDVLGGEIEEIEEALKIEREALERLTTHVEQLNKLKKAAKGGLHGKIKKHLIEKDFFAERFAQNRKGMTVDFKTRANVTVCSVYDKENLYTGIAICSPKDEFDSLIGQYVALKRAVGKDDEIKELCI